MEVSKNGGIIMKKLLLVIAILSVTTTAFAPTVQAPNASAARFSWGSAKGATDLAATYTARAIELVEGFGESFTNKFSILEELEEAKGKLESMSFIIQIGLKHSK